MGTARTTWLIMSGEGVMTAATMKMMSTAYLNLRIMPEQRAAREEQGGEEDEGPDVLFFLLVQAGRDEFPDLVKKDGRGEENRREKGDFHVDQERLGQLGENELRSLGQVLGQGLREDGVKLLAQEPGGNNPPQNDQKGDEDPLPPLFEVFEESHLVRRLSCFPHPPRSPSGGPPWPGGI